MVHQHRPIAMRPSVWGPIFWHTMHIISLGYPEEPDEPTRQAASSFYQSLSALIPCPICRVHYANHLKANPVSPSLDTRKDLFTWTVKIHNLVNKDLGKPEYTEMESIAFYHSLGDLGRSPVWTPQDIHSIQFKEALQLAGITLAAGATLGVGYYIFTNFYSIK